MRAQAVSVLRLALKYSLIAVLEALLPLSQCQAELVVNVQEVEGDVIASFNGILNLEGLNSYASFSSGGINSSGIFSGTNSTVAIDVYYGLTSYPEGRSGTGWGGYNTTRRASSVTGDLGIGAQTLNFGKRGKVWVPDGYSSGSILTARMSWEDRTIDSLHLVPGTYVWEWDADRVVVNIIPEPSTATLLLVCILPAVFRRRR